LSDNFDSNITAQRFVNTEKLTFKVDDLQTLCKKRDAILARLHSQRRRQCGPSS